MFYRDVQLPSEETFDMSEGDTMILGYLKDYTLPKIKYTDATNKTSRSRNRPAALFSLYPNPQSVSVGKCDFVELAINFVSKTRNRHSLKVCVWLKCALILLSSVEQFVKT